jgi:hypothetical protein
VKDNFYTFRKSINDRLSTAKVTSYGMTSNVKEHGIKDGDGSK